MQVASIMARKTNAYEGKIQVSQHRACYMLKEQRCAFESFQMAYS